MLEVYNLRKGCWSSLLYGNPHLGGSIMICWMKGILCSCMISKQNSRSIRYISSRTIC